MSEDVTPLPNDETQPIFPPPRAVPRRIEPVTDEDVIMEDSLHDVDTISAVEQEEIAAENVPVTSATEEVPSADGEVAPADVPLVEQPMAYSSVGEGETAILTASPLASTVAGGAPGVLAEEQFAAGSVDSAVTDGGVSTADPIVGFTEGATEGATENTDDVAETETPTAAPARGTIDFGLFLLRVTLGIIMALHGADKLFGLFGGSIAGTEELLHSIGFTNYTELLAICAGVTELVGGCIVALGLFAPAGASALLGVMGMAALTHISLGDTAFLSLYEGPYEIIALIAAMSATVILAGAGRWSVDGRWGWATRPKWGALLWLIVGVASAPAMWALLNTQGFPLF